jgi:hypothetical protein
VQNGLRYADGMANRPSMLPPHASSGLAERVRRTATDFTRGWRQFWQGYWQSAHSC